MQDFNRSFGILAMVAYFRSKFVSSVATTGGGRLQKNREQKIARCCGFNEFVVKLSSFYIKVNQYQIYLAMTDSSLEECQGFPEILNSQLPW